MYSTFLFRKYFLIFILVILVFSKAVVDLTNEPTQSPQSEATKTSQRWEDKAILMLLSVVSCLGRQSTPQSAKKLEPRGSLVTTKL